MSFTALGRRRERWVGGVELSGRFGEVVCEGGADVGEFGV